MKIFHFMGLKNTGWNRFAGRAGFILLATLLAACGGGGGDSSAPDRGSNAPTITINGQALLREQPLDGARVTLSRLDVTQTQATENVKGKVITLDIPNQQPVVGANGSISFQVGAALVQDDQLFSVAIACAPVSEHCPFEMPLHAVMSGARLKQGNWTANIATEIAHQRLAYYVAARFGESDLKQEMDTTAKLLMRTDVDGSGGIDYEDILQWNPLVDVESAALLRPQMMADAAGLLKDGAGANAVQGAARTLTSPLLGRVALQGEGIKDGLKVRLSGHYAFVQLLLSDVQIFDVSDPSQPVFVNMLTQASTRDFIVSDQLAYTISSTRFDVIDITDPANPRQQGSVILPYATSAQLQVVGNRAFVCRGSNGIQILDLTNPADPAVGDRIEVSCKKLEVAGQYAYVVTPVATDVDAVLVFDIGQTGTPVQVATLENAGTVRAIRVQGQHAYLVERFPNPASTLDHSELAIFDIGQPANPSLISRYSLLQPQYYLDIQVVDRHLYLLGSVISVIDIGEPARPALLATTDIGRDQYSFANIPMVDDYRNMAMAGQIAFIAYGEWLEIFNVASLDTPQSGSIRTDSIAMTVRFDQNNLYYTNYDQSLHVHDVSNPVAPGVADSISGDDVRSLLANFWTLGTHLYWPVGGRPNPINAIDLSVPLLQGEIVNVALPSTMIWDLEVANGVAYIGDSSGLTIAGLDNPLAPTVISRLPLGEPVSDVALSGNYVFLRLSGRVVVADVLDPLQPAQVSSVDVPTLHSPLDGLGVSGLHVYVASETDSLLVIDASNARAPEVVQRINLGGRVFRISIAGRYAYVLVGGNLVYVLDLADPADPVIVGAARTRGTAMSLAFGPAHLYVATQYGIEIFPLLPEN